MAVGHYASEDDQDALDTALLSSCFEDEPEDIDDVGLFPEDADDGSVSLLSRPTGHRLDSFSEQLSASGEAVAKLVSRSRTKNSVSRWFSSGLTESKDKKQQSPQKVKGICPLCRQAVGKGSHLCASAEWKVREGEKSDAARSDGNALFRRGQYAAAVAAYSEALEHSPNDAKLWSNRAAAYTQLGNYAKALEDSEATIRLAPSWAKGYYRKAMLLEARRDWEAAAVAYRQVLANCAKPEDALAKARRRLPVMEARLQASVRAANLPAPYCAVAVQAWWRGRLGSGLRDKPDADERERRMAAAEAAKTEGNEAAKRWEWQNARESYLRGLSLNAFDTQEPSEDQARLDAALRLNRGLCELRLGRYSQAIQLCTEVLDLEPTSVKARFRRASALNELEDYDAALQDVETALALQPNEKAVLALRQQLHERRLAYKRRERARFGRIFEGA